ncbi:MAG: hypothetical protein D6693_05820 [Planctomycetota bacterium]|nr:MAG: hypothetical protein D6693_05820 [Planctomycetota bacterium]
MAGGVALVFAAGALAQTMSAVGPVPGAADEPASNQALTTNEPPPPPILEFEPPEPNDICTGPVFDNWVFPDRERFVVGSLKPKRVPTDQPDTWLCVVDKEDRVIVSDDNGSDAGNGKGSGLIIGDGNNDGWADVLTNNGDGTYSLRLVVTGFPDGFDGDCNGFFQNAPHGQLGKFRLIIRYINRVDEEMITEAIPPLGTVLRTDEYADEFITGAEAFRLNFTAPDGTNLVHITIDNTVGRRLVPRDVDQICVGGLEPLAPYCLTVVGGLNKDCRPTDTVLCWIDKTCDVILSDDDSGPAKGWSEICVIADANGMICFAVSGAGDDDCDGLVNGVPHGVVGDYVIEVRRADRYRRPMRPGCTDTDGRSVEMAARGDLNADGVVDTLDLVTLLANWGVVIPG